MAFWAAARFQPTRAAGAAFPEALRLRTYLPRLREQRIRQGRRVEVTPPLFPGYAFVVIELQWHAAHRAPGTLGLVMNGGGPAHVSDDSSPATIARAKRPD